MVTTPPAQLQGWAGPNRMLAPKLEPTATDGNRPEKPNEPGLASEPTRSVRCPPGARAPGGQPGRRRKTRSLACAKLPGVDCRGFPGKLQLWPLNQFPTDPREKAFSTMLESQSCQGQIRCFVWAQHGNREQSRTAKLQCSHFPARPPFFVYTSHWLIWQQLSPGTVRSIDCIAPAFAHGHPALG